MINLVMFVKKRMDFIQMASQEKRARLIGTPTRRQIIRDASCLFVWLFFFLSLYLRLISQAVTLKFQCQTANINAPILIRMENIIYLCYVFYVFYLPIYLLINWFIDWFIDWFINLFIIYLFIFLSFFHSFFLSFFFLSFFFSFSFLRK